MKTNKTTKLLLTTVVSLGMSASLKAELPDSSKIGVDIGVDVTSIYRTHDDASKDQKKLHLQNQDVKLLLQATYSKFLKARVILDASNLELGDKDKTDNLIRQRDAGTDAEFLTDYLEEATIQFTRVAGKDIAIIFGKGTMPFGQNLDPDNKFSNHVSSLLPNTESGNHDSANINRRTGVVVELGKDALSGVLDKFEFGVFDDQTHQRDATSLKVITQGEGDSATNTTHSTLTESDSEGIKSFAVRMSKEVVEGLKLQASAVKFQDTQNKITVRNADGEIVKAEEQSTDSVTSTQEKDSRYSIGFIYEDPESKSWKIYGEYIHYSGDEQKSYVKTAAVEAKGATAAVPEVLANAENEFVATLGAATKLGPGIASVELRMSKLLANGIDAEKGEAALTNTIAVGYLVPVSEAIDVGGQIEFCDSDVEEALCPDWAVQAVLHISFYTTVIEADREDKENKQL